MVTMLDLSVIAIYLGVMFIGTSLLSRGQGLDGFLVNSRKTKLTLLVLSIVSTNIGAGLFLSVAAEAYSTGISFGLLGILLVLVTSLILAYFAPRIKSLSNVENIYTLPEFLAKRYNSLAVRLMSAIILLIGYLFVTALQFVGIGAIGLVITDFDFTLILVASGLVTIAYVLIGGIRSDIYADAISFIITLVTLAVILPFIFGGAVDLTGLPTRYFDPFAFGGPVFLVFGVLFGAIGAFLMMELWQRIFAAEGPETARKAFIISAFIQIPFIIIGLLIGLAAVLVFPDVDKNIVVFRMMLEFLPPGFLGLGLVAILAILMDTINSLVVVGGSTLFNDFYQVFSTQKGRPDSLGAVRLFTAIFGFAALGMAVFIPDIVRLLLIGAFLMMPIGPAVVGALIWKRATAKAAFLSMVIGFAVTLLLIPGMPELAFIPGFGVSLFIFIALSLFSNKQQKLYMVNTNE